MRGTKMSAKPRAGRENILTLAALPALTMLLLAANPFSLNAEEPKPVAQPLKEAIQAGSSKPARFVLADGRTVVGRIVRIDPESLVIRRPSAGLMSLSLIDIVGINIKSANGELLPGRLTRMADGGLGWLADSDTAEAAVIASLKTNSHPDKGGPLIRIDTPIDDEDVDGETVEVELAKLEAPDASAPDAAPSPTTQPIRLAVTAEETSESAKLMYFRLTLSEPATRSILVIYTMINGSAVAPGDYTHRQGVVVFEPGQTQAVVATSIINDNAVEGAESFTFFVTGDPAAVAIDERKTAATIADDDG